MAPKASREAQRPRLSQDLQPPVGAGHFAASVHLIEKVTVFFRFFLFRLDHDLSPLDCRSADTQIAGDPVAGVTEIGPLTATVAG